MSCTSTHLTGLPVDRRIVDYKEKETCVLLGGMLDWDVLEPLCYCGFSELAAAVVLASEAGEVLLGGAWDADESDWVGDCRRMAAAMTAHFTGRGTVLPHDTEAYRLLWIESAGRQVLRTHA